MELNDLVSQILAFRDERDWAQFHSPENLASALSIEAAELQELFLWMDSEEVERKLTQQSFVHDASREIADVLILALLFCDAIDAGPADVIQAKLAENEAKYPADLSRGRANKYTELDQRDDRAESD